MQCRFFQRASEHLLQRIEYQNVVENISIAILWFDITFRPQSPSLSTIKNPWPQFQTFTAMKHAVNGNTVREPFPDNTKMAMFGKIRRISDSLFCIEKCHKASSPNAGVGKRFSSWTIFWVKSCLRAALSYLSLNLKYTIVIVPFRLMSVCLLEDCR